MLINIEMRSCIVSEILSVLAMEKIKEKEIFDKTKKEVERKIKYFLEKYDIVGKNSLQGFNYKEGVNNENRK